MKLNIHQKISEISEIIGDLCKSAISVEFKVHFNVGLHAAHDGNKVCW